MRSQAIKLKGMKRPFGALNSRADMMVFSTVLHEITAFIRVVVQNVSDRAFCAIFLLHPSAGLPRMRAT